MPQDMTVLIDTHAHLTDDRFRGDLPAVLERAQAAGVGRIVVVATTAADTVAAISLAATYSAVLSPTAGIHPNNAAEAAPESEPAPRKKAARKISR